MAMFIMKSIAKKKVVLLLCIGIIAIAASILTVMRNINGPVYCEGCLWSVDYDPKNGDALLIRSKSISDSKSDINKLIIALNGTNENPEIFRTPDDKEPNDPPKVKLLKIEKETVHIEIINSEYLTQRMGTSGAQDYLAVATYTLTECPHINKVNYIFDEGDHASPGIYTRQYFTVYYKIHSGEVPRE